MENNYVNNHNLEILNNKYRIEQTKLGSGSFATVYLGTDIQLNKKIAIKKISIKEQLDKLTEIEKSDRLQKMDREINIMKDLDHPNIVKLLDVVKTSNYWYIIMEYCDKGTLKDVIDTNKKLSNHFKIEANTYYYLSQLRSALHYINHKGYIHRDIKPTNILLTESIYDLATSLENDKNLMFEEENKKNSGKIILKIADFGLARNFDSEDSLLKTTCGSPMYMAPELLTRNRYNMKADFWSYGIIMYELLFGERPFKVSETSRNPYEDLVMMTYTKNIDFHIDYKYTSECNDLLQRLLNKNKDSRINWEQFMAHQWFIYWDNYTKTDLKNSTSGISENSTDSSRSGGSYSSGNDIINSLSSSSFSPKSPLSTTPTGTSSIVIKKVSASNLSRFNHSGYFNYSGAPIQYSTSLPSTTSVSPQYGIPIEINTRRSSYVPRPISRSNSGSNSGINANAYDNDVTDDLDMSSAICNRI